MSEVKLPHPRSRPAHGRDHHLAGPCSVESAEQFEEVAECVADLGLHWIRGGRSAAHQPAFFPRSRRRGPEDHEGRRR